MESNLTERNGKQQIEFFGHVFAKDGPYKVRAIKECGMPENKEAVKLH